MKNFIWILFLILSFTSCYYDNVGEMHPEAGLVPDCDDDTTLVTYNKDIQPLLLNNCGSSNNGCHGSNSINLVSFDTYDHVFPYANSGEILGAITHDPNSNPMPPFPTSKLSDCKINKVKAWINQGKVE